MCLKEVFKDWKEVFKISFVVVLVFILLESLVGFIGYFRFAYGMEMVFVQGFSTIIFLGASLLTTTFILDKKIKKGNGGILLGNVMVILFYLLFEFLIGLVSY